jgi:hypothetical protein
MVDTLPNALGIDHLHHEFVIHQREIPFMKKRMGFIGLDLIKNSRIGNENREQDFSQIVSSVENELKIHKQWDRNPQTKADGPK